MGFCFRTRHSWRITTDFDYLQAEAFSRFGLNRSELVVVLVCVYGKNNTNTHIWKVGVRFINSRFPRTMLLFHENFTLLFNF